MLEHSRPPSPTTPTGPLRKRRRKIWSCSECRKKKLQCDRTLPACGRCTKAGKPEACIYIDDANEPLGARTEPATIYPSNLHGRFGQNAQTSAPTRNEVMYASVEDLHTRIGQLEEALAQQTCGATRLSNSSRLPPTPGSTVAKAEHNQEGCGTTLFLGKSFRTKFNGSTHSGLLIGNISDFSEFTTETFERFPAIKQLRRSMRKQESLMNPTRLNSRAAIDGQLRALLPPRDEADQLVQAFMDSFDCIYHVLHLPGFRKEYDQLWLDTGDNSQQFVVLVLLIIAVSLCLTGDTAAYAARQQATTIISSCEHWLQRNCLKYSRIHDFQISFLLLFARQINGRRHKQTWANSGKVLRDFICAGLHQDPNNLREEMSARDKEMRRRIWAAAAEFELQASFEHGMPAMPWPEQSDALPPGNIPDNELDDTLDPRPVQDATPISYLAAAGSSILFRHTLNSHLNNLQRDISFDQTKTFNEKIETYLESIPSWMGPRSETPHVLLSINLLQYQLALHNRQAQHAATSTERKFSKMILLDTAVKIIRSHRAVLDSGNSALELLCGDHIRAALSICYVYITLDPRSEHILTMTVEQDAAQAMNDAVTMLKRKVIRLGSDQRHLWTAIAAETFMKLKNEPNRREDFMQEAANKYLSILNEMAGGPTDLLKQCAKTREAVDEPSNNVDPLEEAGLLVPTNLEAWPFDEWDFDDYSMTFPGSPSLPF